MSVARALLLVIGLLLVSGRPMPAQISTVTIIGGSPAPMTISTVAAAGLQPTAVSNAATSYRVTVFGAGTRKITARLNAPMPAFVTLRATLEAPGGGGGTSTGAVILDSSNQDMVLGITGAFLSTRTITYQLSATVAAGVIPSQSRQVTFTIVAQP